MDSKAASKKVDQSVKAETAPKKSGGLLQQLFSCCTSSGKKQDRDSDKPSKSSKETAKPRKNKVQESIKRTRSPTSTSNPDQVVKSKRRSERSKTKWKENSTKKEKENENKESKDREKKKTIDKDNTETKLKESIGNKEKEEKGEKEKKKDRRKRKKNCRKENREKEKEKEEKERGTTGKREDEQKLTIKKEREKQDVREIQIIKEERMKRKNHGLIDNMAKVENKKNTESEAFSKSHNEDKKFASFPRSSSAVGGLYSDQRELPAVEVFPDFKEITNLPYEPPPSISVQKHDELPSTSYQFCAPVESHKQIQMNIDGPCSGYCARYLETDCTNKKWEKFAKEYCKTKIKEQTSKPQKRSKYPKPKKESHPTFKDIVEENWKKLQTKLPFLRKKSQKSSNKRYYRSHSSSEKKSSKCKVKYCPSEECKEQPSFRTKNKKSKEKCKCKKKDRKSSKKDKACSVRSSLELITVCTTRRVRTKKSTENISSKKSVHEEEI